MIESKQLNKIRQQYAQQQQKICRQCNQIQTADNPFRGNIDQGWDICMRCFHPQIQLVIDGVYLGNQDAAMDTETIQKYQIRAICTCGYLGTPFSSRKMTGKFGNIAYVKYDVGDFYDQNISQYFDFNYEWMEERRAQGRNILVHCAGGVSRSASFTIAYLMKKENMTYLDAFAYVKQRRNVINPNPGFKTQLNEYWQKIQIQKNQKTVENQRDHNFQRIRQKSENMKERNDQIQKQYKI